MLGHVLPDDFFCEKAGRRTAAAFGLWLFLPGSEGVGADTVSGCHFAIGAIFKFCKDFFTDIANQLIFSYDIYANLSAFAQYSGKICMKD